MSRTVKTTPESVALALLTRSARFETARSTHPLETIEVHAIMNELASITSQSLAPLAPPPSHAAPAAAPAIPAAPAPPARAAAATPPTAARPTAPPAASAPPAAPDSAAEARARAMFSTRNRNYQPALGDDYLVEALLKYHGEKQRRAGRAPQRSVIKAEAEPLPEPSFEAASFPQVDAAPKASSIQSSRAGAIRQPILRAPRRDRD